MKRRTFLTGTAATVAGLSAQGAPPASADAVQTSDVAAALSRFRQSIPKDFDHDYVEHALIPFFLTSVFQGEPPTLPMINPSLSKENAFPVEFLGLIYKGWAPSREEGVTVFLQGLEYRGVNNLRKRIYMTALTPDLNATKYHDKISVFFNHLLDDKFANKPFMRHYLDYYFDIYWDLHLGVRGEDIPAHVRATGEAFNTVLALLNPLRPDVHENYMKVRGGLDPLRDWIDSRVGDIESERRPGFDKTFVHYWLKNAGDGENFSKRDIVFECFHNFVALSQWGNMLYQIMSRLSPDGGHPEVRDAFVKTMSGDYDDAKNTPYTPLDLFVMELFRSISANSGSISTLSDTRESIDGPSPFQSLGLPYERHSYINTPHPSANLSPVLWSNPQEFEPERFLRAPTSDHIDDPFVQKMGFAKCPFDRTKFDVADGRKASLHNSGFGTVFGVVDDKPLPVCDYAGFVPFGMGYRRCPGEQLTVAVMSAFLRKVWVDKIEFSRLHLASPGRVPIGPASVIDDDIGFSRRA